MRIPSDMAIRQAGGGEPPPFTQPLDVLGPEAGAVA